MGEIHVFIDETGNPNISSQKGAEKYFGIGSAIFETPVTTEQITQALDKLAATENLEKSDKKTVQRGYFSAKKDGPEAHSQITQLINTLNLDFKFTRVDKTQLRGPDLKMSESEFHKHMTQLCTVIGARKKIDRMFVHVAERSKSFGNYPQLQWTNILYDAILRSVTITPLISFIFPQINLLVVSGADPGIQITDFLLWACRRKYINPDVDEIWYKRIISRFNITADVKTLGMFTADLTVGKGTKTIPSIEDYEFTWDEISSARKGIDQLSLATSLILIENIVLHFLVRRHDDIEYLMLFVDIEATDIKNKQALTITQIEGLCKLFLMVFDTMNIMEGYSHEDRKHLLVAKLIACELISREFFINRLFISNYWRTHHAIFVEYHKY